jgi:hypothetical protein
MARNRIKLPLHTQLREVPSEELRKDLEAGLWSCDRVVTDNWFVCDWWSAAFWCDCLMAQGMIGAVRDHDGKSCHRRLYGREV